MTQPPAIAALSDLYYRYHQACLAFNNANSPYPTSDDLRQEYFDIGVSEFNKMIKQLEQAKEFFESELVKLAEV